MYLLVGNENSIMARRISRMILSGFATQRSSLFRTHPLCFRPPASSFPPVPPALRMPRHSYKTHGGRAPLRFEEYLNLLLREKRRVEATVLLRRLAHFDRNPPHLAAAASGRGRAACVPAWYQELAVTRQSATGTGGGEIEEVLDLTAKEVEVVECYDNEPLDCVMMTVVKQEPGLEEEEEGKEKTVAVGFDQKASGGCATLTKDSVNVLPATLSLVKKELG